MRIFFSIAIFILSLNLMAQSPEVKFGTKNASKWEQGIVTRMQDMLKEYDLTRWIFTDTVAVEDNVIPHSHPVLTLSTKKQSNDELLSTFVHEQIHWYCAANEKEVNAAINEFRGIYEDVPVGGPDGAKDEYSTYLHLIVCYLEYQSMVELTGKDRAVKVMEDMNHYRWIYQKVLTETDRIGKVIKSNKLDLLNQ